MKYGEGTPATAHPPKADKPKIGVFDSGVGGLSVAQAIEEALPNYEVLYATDKEHLPYGNKTPKQLHTYVVPILEELVRRGCEVIVIACNTVTTNIIATLRNEIKVPLVAIEPMVKPAAELTKSGIIAVCATPATLSSKRYQWLKDEYAKGVEVLEPDCSDWTQMIEDNQLDHQKIEDRISEVCDQGADVIVLGCTHYHWIEDLIKDIVKDRAKVIQPEPAIVAQLKRVLAQLD
ncbi:MAG TPA: glutamate racemase [Candidatus Saccharimonadales bacterium]|nr:glutamate racemase [Candidatus Saccharimonadales bacterium]